MLNMTILEFRKEEAFLPEKRLTLSLRMRLSAGGWAERAAWVELTV